MKFFDTEITNSGELVRRENYNLWVTFGKTYVEAFVANGGKDPRTVDGSICASAVSRSCDKRELLKVLESLVSPEIKKAFSKKPLIFCGHDVTKTNYVIAHPYDLDISQGKQSWFAHISERGESIIYSVGNPSREKAVEVLTGTLPDHIKMEFAALAPGNWAER